MGIYFEVASDGSLRAANLYRPFLINAGFEIWQRGVSFPSVADNVYTADKWKTGYDTGSGEANVTSESGASNVNSGTLSMKVVYTKSASGYFEIKQNLDTATVYEITKKALKVNFRIFVKTSVASSANIIINDGIGSTVSTFHTGDGTWQELSVSRTINLLSTSISVSIRFASSGTYYIDSGSITIGEISSTYSIIAQKDLDQSCQRYYEIGSITVKGVGLSDTGTRKLCVPISFNTIKANIPTITITPGTVYGGIGTPTLTAFDITRSGFNLEITDTTGASSTNGFGSALTWAAEVV